MARHNPDLGPTAQKDRVAQLAERRTRVFQMLRDGVSIAETARQLQVSTTTVFNDRAAALDELKQHRLADVQAYRDLQQARLDNLLQLVTAKMRAQMRRQDETGRNILDPQLLDLDLVREARAIIKEQSTLMGANAPLSINVNVTMLEKIVALVMNQGGDPSRLFNAIYDQLLGAMDISELPEGNQLAPGAKEGE